MTDTVGAIGRSTRTLTLGSVAAQGMSALSQFLLVAWLTPTDFGLFAAANAALIALLALTNLGEVNAFLTGAVVRPSELLRTTFRVNCALALLGCIVALGIYATDRGQLALMVTLVALAIPFTGGALAWNAVAIRSGSLRSTILGQFSGAGAKLVCGVLLAASTTSPTALPLALAVGAGANIVITRRMLASRKVLRTASPELVAGRSRFDRTRWAAQSLVQFFGAQSDYLVIALVASPYTLGIYFLAYQATVGVSALVSGPLMKSGLVELGRSRGADLEVTKRLALLTSTYVAVLSALGGGAVMALSPHFPGAWSAAGAPLVMLLGSLTGRLLTPVLEAQLLASGRVGRSFWINGSDVIGTATAALTVVTGNVLWVALAVSTWKVIVCGLRCLTVFRGRGVLVALPALASLLVHGLLAFGATQGSLLAAGVLIGIGLLMLAGTQLFARTR